MHANADEEELGESEREREMKTRGGGRRQQ